MYEYKFKKIFEDQHIYQACNFTSNYTSYSTFGLAFLKYFWWWNLPEKP